MRKSGWIVVGAAAVALAGCAGSMEKSALAPEAELTRDQAYVGRVERIARQRGIAVVWVNRPKRDKPAAETASTDAPR